MIKMTIFIKFSVVIVVSIFDIRGMLNRFLIWVSLPFAYVVLTQVADVATSTDRSNVFPNSEASL